MPDDKVDKAEIVKFLNYIKSEAENFNAPDIASSIDYFLEKMNGDKQQ